MTTGGTETGAPPENVRLRDAMPKPLLAVFGVLAVAALALVVTLMVRPPQRSAVTLGERHSPPSARLTHDVGRVAPAPIPSPAPASAPVCDALANLRIEAGLAGQARLGAAVRELCRLASGAGPEVAAAVRGLDGATLRFAAFERTGEEATTDVSARIVYVNLRFARSSTPTILVAPVLAHEGWHLANGGLPGARDEYRSRIAELQACRQLVDTDKWIRNCEDADDLVKIGEERAVALLVAAGYER